jgi:broad specificity phosphatase PhoE
MGEASEKLQIFMLRHGKILFPGEGSYIYGHTDYPLSADGTAQAGRIGAALSGIRMDRIVSSDLSRAANTARIVAEAQRGGAKVELTSDIREIFMGEWEGMRKDEILERYPEVFRARGMDFENVAAPGGETFREARDRGVRALSEIINASTGLRRVLIVAHSAILWGIMSSIFGLRLGEISRFWMDYCALHLVEHSPAPDWEDRFRLVRYNWSPDLMEYNRDTY